MMRYIAMRTAPKSGDWEDQPPIAAATTIYEPDDAPINTGLLDVNGTPLYRLNDKMKMGFV
jgi:hypothetical protein